MTLQFAGAGTPLDQAAFDQASQALELGSAELWALLSVETAGCGYLADRRPKILFERHVFSRLTGGRFDADDPDISNRSAGGYGPSGAHQYDRLSAALQLDVQAALESASWGLGQVMGENYNVAGFNDVRAMVDAMVASEGNQLLAVASYLRANQLAALLRAHDWSGFARRYNGPDYAAHNYDGLLQHFFARYSNGGTPDLTVRAVQTYLAYEGYSVGGVDGIFGPRTEAAIIDYQRKEGIATTGQASDELLKRLSGR